MKLRVSIVISCIFMISIPHSNGAEKVKLGVAWHGKADMATRVTNAMNEVLSKQSPQIEIEWQRELSSIKELDDVAKRFQREKDGMLLVRSSGAKYLRDNTPTIPSFIGGCNHPVLIGVVKSMGRPEGRITGVTYALEYEKSFKVFNTILPDIKSICLIYEVGHPGSLIDRIGTKKVCEQLSISYSDVGCSTRADVVRAIKKTAGTVSAIIYGTQALVFDNAYETVPFAGNTPVFAYSAKPVKDGALCGLIADDSKLGTMLAQSIIDVLVHKKPISEVPIKTDAEPLLVINMKTAKKIGVVFPISILKVATIIKE